MLRAARTERQPVSHVPHRPARGSGSSARPALSTSPSADRGDDLRAGADERRAAARYPWRRPWGGSGPQWPPQPSLPPRLSRDTTSLPRTKNHEDCPRVSGLPHTGLEIYQWRIHKEQSRSRVRSRSRDRHHAIADRPDRPCGTTLWSYARGVDTHCVSSQKVGPQTEVGTAHESEYIPHLYRP